MKLTYRDDTHEYFADGIFVPSLTQMLSADGLDADLDRVPLATLEAKRDWGTRLHLALLRAEYGDGVDPEFKQHCVDWLDTLRKMKWMNPQPIWKNAEMPVLGECEGFIFGFTPDRVSPEAVVEIKGTYSPSPSHGIQTALQVIGMGYPRTTPRWLAYFDKERMKKLCKCSDTVKRNGQILDVWAEAERIIFEHAIELEKA